MPFSAAPSVSSAPSSLLADRPGGVSGPALLACLDGLLTPAAFKDYGPNGLQVQGKPCIRHVVTGVTASLALIEAAVAAQADAVLVHHGLFWRGQSGCVTGWMHQRLKALLTHDINLFAYHLPLDAHPELGNNAQLARVLGLPRSLTVLPASVNTTWVFWGTARSPAWVRWRPMRSRSWAAAWCVWAMPHDPFVPWRGAQGAHSRISKPPLLPERMCSSPASCPSPRPTMRGNRAWPTWHVVTTRPSVMVCRRWDSTWPTHWACNTPTLTSTILPDSP
jgi:putative NIF3 family GTP cyclohydrolase 1 type 2